MKVALFGKSTSENTAKYSNVLIEALLEFDVTIVVEEESYNILLDQGVKIADFETCERISENSGIDLIFTIGGDGTILRVMSFVRDSEIPIVGINTGRLGFMTTISKEDIYEKVNAIVKGNYKIRERALLELKTSDKVEGMPYNYALNEIAVNRKEATSMVTVDAFLNNEFLNSYWGDGLIIATPTGSTGYSLSCGGPIIMPNSSNLVITPIAPHNLYTRPFVITDNTEIELHIKGRAGSYLVSLDSNIIAVPNGIRLCIKKSDFVVKMVRFEDERFLSTLRKKLYWGEDYRN